MTELKNSEDLKADRDVSQTLCEYRWTHPVVSLAQGDLRFCCHTPPRKVTETELLRAGSKTFLNSDFDRERRLQMLSGQRSEECRNCWIKEDAGVHSSRSFSPEAFNEKNFSSGFPYGDWKKIKETAAAHPEWLNAGKPRVLEVMLGNLCDMKCIYCNSFFSTRWASEQAQFGEKSRNELLLENPPPAPSFEKLFWRSFEQEMIAGLSEISILGGEPLINEKFYEFLDRLEAVARPHGFDSGRRGPDVAVITNLNGGGPQLERFMDRAAKLDGKFRINLNVSMESFGRKSEYIRYGLHWDRWLENFRTILQKPFFRHGVCLQTAVNALSLSSLEELLRLAHQLTLEYKTPIYLRSNMVVDPAYLSPLILPPSYAAPVEQCAQFVDSVQEEMASYRVEPWGAWDQYGRFLKALANSLRADAADPEDRRSFYRFIQKIDARRGHRFTEVFPEYGAFYEACSRI